MLQADQFVIDKYRVLNQAGVGDLGPVYRVQDVKTRQICALKTLTLPRDTGSSLFARLLEDTDKIQALRHPHIVPPGRMEGTEENQPSFVREFFEGMTLDELIRKEAPLPLHRACSIARQIAQGLEAAHHAGIVHGDLTPSSVLLVSEDGRESAKVLGFGFFSVKQDRFVELSRLAIKEGDGHVIGTPEYVSPEQAMGSSAEILDGRSDLYSLGVIWYQMLAGETPFHGNNAMEILLAHLFKEPQPLYDRPELRIPETIDRLLMRTLAKKREDRPASATALIDQLTAWEEPMAPSELPVAFNDAALDVDLATEPPTPELPPVPHSRQPVIVPPYSAPSKPETAPGPHWNSPTPETVVPQPSTQVTIERQEKTPSSLESASLEPSEMRPSPARFSPEVEAPFVADIQPSPPATNETRRRPLDIPLHEEEPPRVAPTPTRIPSAPGSIIFGGYAPQEVKPHHKGLRWWAAAAIIVVILLGAGCGWLYYTGRTYWFRPDYAKWRISTFLSSFSIPEPEKEAKPAPTPPTTSLPAPSAGSEPRSVLPANKSSLPTTAAPVKGPSSIAPMRIRGHAGGNSPASKTEKASSMEHVKAPIRRASANSRIAETPAMTNTASATRGILARGDYFFERGEYDNAIQTYESGLAQDPGNQKLIDGIARAKRAKAAEAKFLGP